MCYSKRKFKIIIKLWIRWKKDHAVIKFNQKAWLNPYIDMNAKLRKKAKNNFKKDFMMNNSSFKKLWKMWENTKILSS